MRVLPPFTMIGEASDVAELARKLQQAHERTNRVLYKSTACEVRYVPCEGYRLWMWGKRAGTYQTYDTALAARDYFLALAAHLAPATNQ